MGRPNVTLSVLEIIRICHGRICCLYNKYPSTHIRFVGKLFYIVLVYVVAHCLPQRFSNNRTIGSLLQKGNAHSF